MDEFTNWTNLFYGTLSSVYLKIVAIVPTILLAIFILLVGWFISKMISTIVFKLLTKLKFDDLAEKVNARQLLEKANVSLTPSNLIGRFIYWFMILMVIMTASDALGWQSITKEISGILSHLPRIFIAIISFVIGVFIAGFVRDVIAGATSSIGLSVGKIISNLVYYFLFILAALTALRQGGFDTTIISSNLLLIIGTILLAAGISYGFASREVLSHLLAGYFSRNNFHEGDIIEVDGVKGKIVDRSGISVTIKVSETEKMTIPMHKLISQNVKIFNQ